MDSYLFLNDNVFSYISLINMILCMDPFPGDSKSANLVSILSHFTLTTTYTGKALLI